MMHQTTSVRLPYALLFISDEGFGEDPEPSGDHIKWTESSICISCIHDQFGATTITLGPVAEVAERHEPVFDGEISTLGRAIVLSTAHLDIVLKTAVPTQSTRVRIWENRPVEPDRITVGVG